VIEPSKMTRTATRLIIVLAGVCMATVIIRNSLDPANYFRYGFERHVEREWEHPTFGVALVALATLLEAAATYFVFAVGRPGRVWMRGAGMLFVLVPWNAIMSDAVVHAPGFYILHVLWLWAVLAVILPGTGLSLFAHLLERLRSHRSRSV
jgi:hypothetical protein